MTQPASKPATTPKRASTPPSRSPELLFLDEVAQELRISVHSVRRLIKGGELRAMKITSQYRVSRFDLQKFLRDARERPVEADDDDEETIDRDQTLLERDETALAQVLGAAVLLTIQEGAGVYLRDRDGCELLLVEYIRRARPDLATSAEGASGFVAELYKRHVLDTTAGRTLDAVAAGTMRVAPLSVAVDLDAPEAAEAPWSDGNGADEASAH